MAVGDIVGSALLHCIGRKPPTVFSSTEQECRLMAGLSQDAAGDIAREHDWRVLTKVHTFAPAVTSAPLPSDYDRMVFGVRIADAYPIIDLDEWINTDNPGWIVLGGHVEFRRPPGPGAKMAYVSCEWAARQDGTPAREFMFDDDEFVLPGHLLRLSLIWRYKEATGLDYTEDMANYEIALARAQSRDKGAYVVTSRGPAIDRRTYTGRAP